MKPGRSALRHAADCSFLLRQTALAARDLEDKAPNRDVRRQAARIKTVAFELRKHARALEASL